MDPRLVVERFYGHVRDGDVAGLVEVVEENFSDDVVLHEPESLPYGGAHKGRERVKQMLRGIGSPRSPIVASELQLEEVLVAPGVDSIEAFAALSFPWRPFADNSRRVKALERWTFRDDKVERVAVFLWDTVPCVEALRQES